MEYKKGTILQEYFLEAVKEASISVACLLDDVAVVRRDFKV